MYYAIYDGEVFQGGCKPIEEGAAKDLGPDGYVCLGDDHVDVPRRDIIMVGDKVRFAKDGEFGDLGAAFYHERDGYLFEVLEINSHDVYVMSVLSGKSLWVNPWTFVKYSPPKYGDLLKHFLGGWYVYLGEDDWGYKVECTRLGDIGLFNPASFSPRWRS